MLAKCRKATGQNAGQLESSYSYAAAMAGLHERAMDRRGETRSAIRHRPGFRLPYRRSRPTEGRGALPEGESGG